VAWAILDTNVYIGHWAAGLYEGTLAQVRRSFVVRHSAVVLSELHRGARTREALRLVESLARHARAPWEPTADDWWEAGRLVRVIGDAESWEVGKRRDFQNDALIALTARRHGATVVTANQGEFALLASRTQIRVFAARES
jgi:predicted nucleic acid-binding protein